MKTLLKNQCTINIFILFSSSILIAIHNVYKWGVMGKKDHEFYIQDGTEKREIKRVIETSNCNLWIWKKEMSGIIETSKVWTEYPPSGSNLLFRNHRLLSRFTTCIFSEGILRVDSVTDARKEFWRHSNLRRRGLVLWCHIIKTWVENVEETDSVL